MIAKVRLNCVCFQSNVTCGHDDLLSNECMKMLNVNFHNNFFTGKNPVTAQLNGITSVHFTVGHVASKSMGKI